MQEIIILIILIIALIYVTRQLTAVFRPGASSCGGCCSGCTQTGCGVTTTHQSAPLKNTELPHLPQHPKQSQPKVTQQGESR